VTKYPNPTTAVSPNGLHQTGQAPPAVTVKYRRGAEELVFAARIVVLVSVEDIAVLVQTASA